MVAIIIILVFSSATKASVLNFFNSSDSLKINLYLNIGTSYSYFSTILGLQSDVYENNLDNCLGFHFGLGLNRYFYKNLYWGLEANIDYLPTKVAPDISHPESQPFLINKNAKATYKAFIFNSKFGYNWGKIKFTKWNLFLFPYPLFTYGEINIGFGKAWYLIDQLVTGAKNDDVLDDNWTREQIQLAMRDSELLHILNSEYIFSIGINFGRTITKRINLSLSYKFNVGLEYNRYYEGEWYGGGTVEIWHDSHTERMTANSLILKLNYKIF